jgi:uncharacterized protein
MLRFIVAVWLALCALPAAAQTFPALSGRVVDQADLLRPEQEIDLTSKLAALETQTGRQFVVATVKSLEGRTIEDYGYRLGRTWAIGDKQKDDGVILLVAPKERKVRIETGYGARVFLTDALSSIIIRENILPKFKSGDMGGGIVAGAAAVIAQLHLSPPEAARAEQVGARAKRAEVDINPIPVIFIVIIFFVIIGSIARRVGGRRYRGHGGKRRRGGLDSGDLAVILWGLDALGKASRGSRGGWSGGGSGGGWGGGGGGFGGFSGGGGSFGGGGASGSW